MASHFLVFPERDAWIPNQESVPMSDSKKSIHRATVTIPVLRPVPTATASAVEDDRLNQAAPTDGGAEKPERLKP
jgi:hypothetical protein